jgi:hypothetical protein
MPGLRIRSLLDDEDGPMLEVLKGFQGRTIELPRRSALHPDRERLAVRFERFRIRGLIGSDADARAVPAMAGSPIVLRRGPTGHFPCTERFGV